MALRIQGGDKNAAELLLSQNEGFLTSAAIRYKSHSRFSILEDLKQEGAIVLLDAAQSFDLAHGAQFLTYATSVVDAAMQDYAAKNALSVSLSPNRYYQLRKVAKLCVTNDNNSDEQIISKIQKELSVSEKVARALLVDYLMFGSPGSLPMNIVSALAAILRKPMTAVCGGCCYSNEWRRC